MNSRAYLFLVILFCGVLYLNAQIMDTVSYVPVKRGSYDKLSTKSSIELSKKSSATSAKTLKVNSSTLSLNTNLITFGKPVFVRDNVFVKDMNNFVIDKLYIQGKVSGVSPVLAKQVGGLQGVSSTNLNIPNRNINAGSNSFMLDGIAFPAPACKLKWQKVYTDKGYYNMLGCEGSSGPVTPPNPPVNPGGCKPPQISNGSGGCCCPVGEVSCMGTPCVTVDPGGDCKLKGCPIGEHMVNIGSKDCCCEFDKCGPLGPETAGKCKCARTDINEKYCCCNGQVELPADGKYCNSYTGYHPSLMQCVCRDL